MFRRTAISREAGDRFFELVTDMDVKTIVKELDN